jgi:hypothetical protein
MSSPVDPEPFLISAIHSIAWFMDGTLLIHERDKNISTMVKAEDISDLA